MMIHSVIFLCLQLVMSVYQGGYNFFCQNTHSGGEADNRVKCQTEFYIVWDLKKKLRFSFTLTKDTIFPMGEMCECTVKLAALLHTLGIKSFPERARKSDSRRVLYMQANLCQHVLEKPFGSAGCWVIRFDALWSHLMIHSIDLWWFISRFKNASSLGILCKCNHKISNLIKEERLFEYMVNGNSCKLVSNFSNRA